MWFLACAPEVGSVLESGGRNVTSPQRGPDPRFMLPAADPTCRLRGHCSVQGNDEGSPVGSEDRTIPHFILTTVEMFVFRFRVVVLVVTIREEGHVVCLSDLYFNPKGLSLTTIYYYYIYSCN